MLFEQNTIAKKSGIKDCSIRGATLSLEALLDMFRDRAPTIVV
jgi:hypothetical protein